MSDSDALNGVLATDEYLGMVRTLAESEGRFETVHTVWKSDDGATIEGLANQLGESEDDVTSHIDAAVDAGLLERWERTERGTVEATTYYQTTVDSDIILSDGILELFEDY